MTTPGWYPDPDGNGQRYWDGQSWGLVNPGLQPPKPKRVILWWSIAAAAIVLVGAGVGGYLLLGGNTVTTATKTTIVTTVVPAPGGPGRDGGLEFTVTGIEPATWYGRPEPQGQYLIVSLEIHNVGDQPQTFSVANQRLVDDQGRQYQPAIDALRVMYGGATNRDLNPGFGLSVQIPFDVPVGVKPASMELHASMVSDGVRVGFRD